MTEWLRGTVISAVGVLAFCALATYCIDPYLRYDKPPLLKPFYKDPYRMVPSLLENRDYDALVAGTSMCMNFSLADVRACLKWDKPMKVAAPGCRSATFHLFVERAFRYHTVRHVLSSVDLLWLVNPPGVHHVPLEPFLYERSFTSECSYLLNSDIVLGAAGETILANVRGDARLNQDLMFGLRDVTRDEPCGGPRVVAELLSVKAPQGVGREALENAFKGAKDRILQNVRRDILPLVREHPDTEFLFFFPPYPNVKWAACLATGKLPTLLEAKELLTDELCACPNVKVFDFQADVALVTDLGQYKDATHYGPHVSRRLLDDMGAGRFRCSPADVRSSSRVIAAVALEALQHYRADLLTEASRAPSDGKQAHYSSR